MRKFVVAVTTATLLFAGIGSATADPVVSSPAADISSAVTGSGATGSVDPAALINALSAAGAGTTASAGGPLTEILTLAAESGTTLAPAGHVIWCIASMAFSATPCS